MRTLTQGIFDDTFLLLIGISFAYALFNKRLIKFEKRIYKQLKNNVLIPLAERLLELIEGCEARKQKEDLSNPEINMPVRVWGDWRGVRGNSDIQIKLF